MKWINGDEKTPDNWTDVHVREAESKKPIRLPYMEDVTDIYFLEQLEWLDESED